MTADKAPGDTRAGELVLVRATVNLGDANHRLPAGATAYVNPDLEYIKEKLAAGYLVPVADPNA